MSPEVLLRDGNRATFDQVAPRHMKAACGAQLLGMQDERWRQQIDRLSTGAEGTLRDLGALARVFVAREGRLLGALAGKMAGAHGGPAVFEVWMKQQSDLVQVLAAPTSCLHQAPLRCRLCIEMTQM